MISAISEKIFFNVITDILIQENSDLSKETLKTYRFILSKFNRYFPGIQCDQISPQTICLFREKMIQDGNSSNTVSKTLASLKTLINKAKDHGLITGNPFEKIKIKKINSTRSYLPLDELQYLFKQFIQYHEHLSLPEKDSVLAFLFSCYTGLRYSDLKSLKDTEIQNGRIRKRMHKTGDIVYIPLSQQAITLINIAKGRKEGHVLKVTENSYFNRHLRSGSQKIGFHKHIHCHLARHTFATTCLSLGIPLEVTSKLLGHKNIETTLIYAKYIDSVLDSEMEKFQKI